MLEFRPFDATDRELVQSYILNLDFRNCDMAFANMFVWRFLYDTQIAEDNGFLYVRYWSNSKPYYMLPLGDGDMKNAIGVLLDFASQDNKRFCMQGISPKMKNKIEQLIPDKFFFTTNRDYADYLYLRNDLVSLKGKKLQSKRNHINKFKRQYPNYTVEPITAQIIPQCIALSERWLQQNPKNALGNSPLSENRAIKNAFAHYDDLGLLGIAIFVEGQLVAFSYGSAINQTTFDVAVEKANSDFVGAYAMINNEFAKYISDSFIYINREEDLGIDGLRKSKLSYQPNEILYKYSAKITPI